MPFDPRRVYRRLRHGEPLVVVSGLPRSGTSMIMQMLAAGGLEVAADFERAADPDNPEGYYELERVKKIDGGRDTAWLTGLRGKAIKIVSHYLQFLPDTNNYRVIFIHRDLDEVLASQARMLDRRGHAESMTDDAMKQLFAEHLVEAARELAGRRCFETLDVKHREAIAEPRNVAARIGMFLRRPLDQEAMVGVVREDLYRNRAE